MAFHFSQLNSNSIGRFNQQNYGIIPGTYRGIHGTKMMPSVFIQNNNYGGGFGMQSFYGMGGAPEPSGWDKAANWLMGFGIGGSLLGGLMNIFGAKPADGQGGVAKTPDKLDQATENALKDAGWTIERNKDGSIRATRSGDAPLIWSADGSKKPSDNDLKTAMTPKSTPTVESETSQSSVNGPDNANPANPTPSTPSADGKGAGTPTTLDQNGFENKLKTQLNLKDLPGGLEIVVADGKATVSTQYGSVTVDATDAGIETLKQHVKDYVAFSKKHDFTQEKPNYAMDFADYNDYYKGDKKAENGHRVTTNIASFGDSSANTNSLIPKTITMQDNTGTMISLTLENSRYGEGETSAPVYRMTSAKDGNHRVDVGSQYAIIDGEFAQPKGATNVELVGAGNSDIHTSKIQTDRQDNTQKAPAPDTKPAIDIPAPYENAGGVPTATDYLTQGPGRVKISRLNEDAYRQKGVTDFSRRGQFVYSKSGQKFEIIGDCANGRVLGRALDGSNKKYYVIPDTKKGWNH